MQKILTLFSLLLFAGCGSSPKTHFYTLSVPPATTGRHSISSPVQLAAVHIPPTLDRVKMVRLTNENSVQISETDRWSAPFDEMVRNILSQDLVPLLPKGKVILPRAPAPPGTGTLVVTIATFGPNVGGEVKLNGSWALLSSNSGAPQLERTFQIDAGPAADAEATAAAMSRALGRLASTMAAGLSRTGF
ncbi:MAG: ABC-type transport auxiliary lipoprotein family protein [Chthoniobacterales bacterium]